MLHVEKHSRGLVERKAGTGQVGPNQRSGDPQAAPLRKPVNKELKWHPARNQWVEGRQRVRKGWLFSDLRPVEL
jgi:hypothetical protein